MATTLPIADKATLDIINANVGSNADVSSATGSVHAKLKDIKNSIAGNSVIKSVQRGVTTLSGTQTNITISAVNVEKAFCNHLFILPPSTQTDIPVESIPQLKLLNSTTLQAITSRARSDHTLSWEVIEFK